MLKAEQVPETVAHVAEAAWSKDATWQQIIAAAIKAWPGMFIRPSVPDGVWHSYDCSQARIILPLPEENING